MWDPVVYRRFASERARPFADLLARVGADRPRAVTDLGCGPGDLTVTLAERWPGARVTGVDSSAEMIERARAERSGAVEFRLGDVREWRPPADVDVLVSNATLQWVPGHRALLTAWAAALPAGAWIAVQVPGNFDAPSHRALREVARSEPFAATVGDVVRDAPVDDAAGYAGLLVRSGAAVDAWETTYVHLLPDTGPDHPVLSWMDGTALRPVRTALDPGGYARFRAALGERLAAAYPARDGVVAFPFRRVFVVARTS
ncbi:trans-aconitate 2-methyltransferase [Jidongwangia harbinensis]|uniref:trans-aconitate 2-methyltransferase n=1 Tax=Jidongwangia harbinensis TaxID=2878561 RepID=UPI001CDA06D2|nr:trans-aconitate 2-methyltransferase [Jidongwangia harbinensis]MCA2214737.1 trans-aconitate 2-methyltransferase [Jidongwangia harbinensis]